VSFSASRFTLHSSRFLHAFFTLPGTFLHADPSSER
jgi:hypothetical protein